MLNSTKTAGSQKQDETRRHWDCTGFDYFKYSRSRTWLDLGTQIQLDLIPDLRENLFWGSQNNTPDETNGVNNAVSCYKVAVYTVSQKKLCQLIFCSFSVKYKPISMKKWKDCSRRNPSQNSAHNAHFT